MPEMIGDIRYWKQRLEQASELHHAIFRCPLETWRRIEAKHREILARVIQPRDSIFDAGCGWGRLLELMPATWDGRYLGVDLSPDFVHMAQLAYPTREFVVGDLRELAIPDRFDWALLISMRPMVKRNLGDDVWAAMERQVRRVATKLLYLEYDHDADGSVE